MTIIPKKDLQKFADLMIQKIEEIKEDPQKTWFSPYGNGLPQNLNKRIYHGINSFILDLLCDINQYRTPVFMTYIQAKQEQLNVKKGEISFPVVYWNFTYKDENGKKISKEDFEQLSPSDKKKCRTIPYARVYPVFNIDQTNMPEAFPEKYKAILDQFKAPELKDEKGMLSCPQLDQMLSDQSWLCPIFTELSDNAYYSPSRDEIHIPKKGQFYTGEDFYNALLHEMGHSTGHSERLNREGGTQFGDEKYGREELVAEMTAAVICKTLGLPSRLQEDNAAYLKNWLGAIKEKPMFLFSVLSDVGKASGMILEEVKKVNLQQDITKNEVPECHLPKVEATEKSIKQEEKKDRSLNLHPEGMTSKPIQLTFNF